MSHPQKYYLKIISKALFLLGLGDVWYETKATHHQKVLYNFYFLIINISNYVLLMNEVLAVVITEDFNYYAQVTVAYVAIGVKAIIIHLRKDRIKKVLERLLENYRDLYQLYGSDNEGVKKAKKYCFPMIIGVYSTFILTTANAVWKHLRKGTPIRTVVTLYPDTSQSGTITNIFHFIVEVHSWYTVSVMVFIDSLCFCSIIFTQFKFRAVNTYFSSIRKNLLKGIQYHCLLVPSHSCFLYESEMESRFLKLLVPVEDTWIKICTTLYLAPAFTVMEFVIITTWTTELRCARNIQYALGNVYNVQVLLSMSLLALCMISILMSHRDVVTLLSGLFAFLTVLMLTGTYMFASGDVTHEASLIPMAMFQSGWELQRSESQLRALMVMALLRAQAPVRMRAFGIINLSYQSFISVLRSSYSCFALMY